ncbi:hypothetical protein DH2020_033467 [Rehmannia glutinosa]|uniref:Single-stranded DNA binding protein Ssb-like OB fold domain-containing protein n=1 Tax=Rehmannia glutinosa TaxID=99300 RepID=A0ABR0VC80_REHGL
MAANGGRGLRKPVFVKVESLKPETNGHTLVVKVVNSTTVLQKGAAASPHLRSTRIAECLVGDDTAISVKVAIIMLHFSYLLLLVGLFMKAILWVAFECPLAISQVDLMKAGNTVILRNAKIDMFKGSMRLAVDKWGRIELTEPATFVVKEDNNLSLVEYELVNVVEQ